METIKNAYNGVVHFCHRVVQWRSPCTVPYIFAVNTTFWAVAYYGTVETQMRSLAALAFIIFCNDVLLSATHDRSVLIQIVTWPIRDLWKTFAVILCGLGIHQLREGSQEEALWCSFVAVSFILISPVYKYNQVNQKIVDAWCATGRFIKNVLTYCIVKPILYIYEAFKYVLLLRWLPGLTEWLRSSRNSLYNSLDRVILQRIRAFGSRCADIFRYWFYFRWVKDLKSVLYVWVGDPLLQKLRVVRDQFVYVFGGYWFYPLMQWTGRKTWNLTCYLMGAANQCAIVVTNSVVWPLVVIAYEKLHEAGVIVYDAYGRPAVNVLHKKYKIAEDTAFIHVIGPGVKTLLDCVPEKNPFCNESDSELDEFLPGPVGDANIPDEEEIVEMEESSEDPLEIHDDELDDLDDDRFLTKRLQRDFSGSDSSDEEFLLFPKKGIVQRRPTNT